ncbi:cupin domain-containing protein [Brasilonema octagenarum UFV-E1]|uniref:Cupin domain-containing protein n=2 Tax=Brasilonema TaxID=383614 RepID=A0A856MJB0_9CYAN|nr:MULTISPECIES: cupin domain-containing protein [Brasilonema]NMF64059.1 cupin domain-containing protein [Brasilonema octagenarum UFV-OR1]QDL11458.1 cupin domain-containing protein [Brasilonema sennae CENA114]QDL11465.1 cupin domain-containing protein [Brasilonema sennae CENA114]QDL17848.1 cupin domain-containing protein [Brasilonema octagenarum UFV-E1]
MNQIASEKVELAEKFSLIDKYWSPKIVGELNGQYVKLAKFKGEFVWHQHDNEDELFLVVKGVLKIKLSDRELTLREGDFAVIPRGVQHLPIADEEVQVLMFEPKSTINTGEVTNELTTDCEWI